jgi:translocation and assembly module TamB
VNLGELLPRLSLPLPVEIERVRGDLVGWSDPAAGSALEFRDLFLSGFWFRALELRELRVTQGGSNWAGELEFDFQAPHGLALRLKGSVVEPELLQSDTPLLLEARGSGDLGRSRWELDLTDPPLAVSGEVRDLLGTPAWDLQVEARHLQWPLAGEDPSITGDGVTGNSYGTATEYGLELKADIGGPGIPPSRVRIVGAGSPAGLDFELIDASGEAIRLQGSGRLDWQAAPAAHAELDVARLDPAYWMEAWGDAAPLQGRLQLSWSDQEIGFELGDVTAAGTVESASGSGAVDLQAGTLAADLEWRGFAWPPGAAEPVVSSSDGRAVLGGRLEQWTVSGEFALSGPDFPPGRLRVRGGGDAESMHLEVPQGSVLGGSLAGQLDVGWSPEVDWAVEARLSDVATGPLAPDFPGRVSGEIAVRGRPDADSLEIDIRNLAGVVRQRRVQAQGLLALEAGRIAARSLTVRSGESQLTLDGHPDGAQGLAFTARIEDLADLVDGASGSLDGSGTVALDADRPRLRLEGRGEGLAWDGTTLAGFSIATDPGDAGAIRLEIAGIDFGEQRIESVVAVADGARPLDRVSASAEFPGARFEIAVDGRVQDWSDLAGGGWVGQVQQLRFEGEGGEFIELEDPVEARFNATAFTLDPACFRGSREGRLCLESTWRPRGERTLAASLEEVSPNLAMTLLDSELLFSQRISGELEWRQKNGDRAAARARLQISAGEITVRDEAEPLIQTGVGLFAFEVSDGRLFAGNLDIPVPGAGGIDTDFSVPDLSGGLNSAVRGRIRMNFNNIEPFLRLVPGVEGSSGPMTADLNFSGTLSDPQLTGHASVVRGTVSHYASGLLLEDIRLAGAVYQYDQTELSGTFRAGSGQGSLRAVVNFHDLLQPEVLLQVKGDELTLVNVPSLNVTANPDVRLVWREGVVNVGGKVVIPTARVSPLYLPTSAATESGDLVIVAGEDPLAKPQDSKAEELRLRGNLELELGDDVRLMLDRAKAQLKGNTRFTWDGQLVPIADGGFVLSGEILAYGQLLKVTEGRINFSNRPADNPFLNIRAEREIYGNSQITRAGVLVTGTLKQPVLEPYSVPMTTRERALTLLVTGSDFDYEQGVGTVEVGMYVAPKLFISYGIGLFEDQNVISARYDLGKGFGVKTTSGQRETGADISYTIER